MQIRTRRDRTRPIALLAAFIAAAAVPAGVRAQQDNEEPAAAAHPVDHAVEVLDRLDHTIVSLDYAGLPLEHVLIDLGRHTPVPLHADWLSLELLGVERDAPIQLQLDNVPLSTALSGLLLHVGSQFDRPCFEYHENRIVITTLDATARMRMLATYNIRDLLADETLVDRLEREAPLPTIAQDDAGTESTTDDHDTAANANEDDDQHAGYRPRTAGEALLDLIADHVDPEAWVEYGGNRAKITEHEGVLLVSAPATLHKKLREAIEQLRRAIPNHVWLEAAIVTIPESTYRSLTRKHRQATAGLARAMIRDANATVLWRNRAGTVAIGEQLATLASSGDTSIELAVTPSLDPRTQLLRLSVNATLATADGRASLRTTAACPDRNSAAILEVAGVGSGEMLQFVVLLPRVG